MNRTQLREAIKSIVARKMDEISIGGDGPESPRKPKVNDNPKYAYITGQITEDPTVQIIGYGSMRLSQLKRLVVEHIGELDKKAKEGRFDQVLYLLKPDGILMLHVNALAELQAAEGKLQEIAPTNMFGQPNQPPQQNQQQPKEQPDVDAMTDADKRALEDATKTQSKLTSDRDRLKGAIQKLQEPVRRKIADAQRKMADIEQKLGVVTKKATDIQKKYNKV